MKKTTLNRAIAAGLAGVAGFAGVSQAVNVNPDGLGQVLIYPYYTVRNGNVTLLSVVNTTEQTKAVRVRWREGKNSRDVRDFNIYLSAFDVWVAAVSPDAGTGGARVDAPDNTCTFPDLTAGGTQDTGIAFTNFDYTGTAADVFNGDTYVADNDNFDRTNEGYFMVYEMGSLDPIIAAAEITGVTHVAGVPADCSVLGTAFSAGIWAANRNNGINPPSGGLMGSGYLLDVAQGTLMAYDARALDNVFVGPTHQDPSDVAPNLGSAQVGTTATIYRSGSADTVEVTPVGVAVAAQAVSATLMADTIVNEYTANTAIGALTDWVVTMPTRALMVDSIGPTAVAPFTELPVGQSVGGGCNLDANFDNGGEEFGTVYYDREEGVFSPSASTIGFEPSPPGPVPLVPGNPGLCFEANVVEFAATGFFGSTNEINLSGDLATAGFDEGWFAMVFKDQDTLDPFDDTMRFGANVVSPKDLDGAGATDDATFIGGHRMVLPGSGPNNGQTVTLDGLPVVGFAGEALRTTAASTNYAGTFDHRFTRDITVS